MDIKGEKSGINKTQSEILEQFTKMYELQMKVLNEQIEAQNNQINAQNRQIELLIGIIEKLKSPNKPTDNNVSV